MSIFHAIIYGIVQGIGEFLPISSSGHLAALPQILGWTDGQDLSFDVALHLGTLVAVIAFFWKDWLTLISAGFTNSKSKEGKLFWYIIIACIPGGIIGILFEKKAESTFRNLGLIGVMMIVIGIFLFVADRLAKGKIKIQNIGLNRSLVVGFSQALAIIPGVSRSGITMSTGLLSGISREDAARFSFLLSTPIIIGAGLLKSKDIIHTPASNIPSLLVAIVTSAVVGFLCIKFLLNYLKNKGFGIFVFYRIVVGLLFISIYLYNK